MLLKTNRIAEKELLSLLDQYPIVTLTGPRQAGKTTLARMACPDYAYASLEDPDVRALAENDPKAFLGRFPAPAIFDEIQRVPSLLSYLQTHVDLLERVGSYILTGSNQFQLSEAVTQSLAGRTALLTLLPFDIAERANYPLPISREDSLRFGFLPAIFDRNMDAYKAYRNYLQTYVERDVQQVLRVNNHRAFENLLRLLAARVGQLVNYTSLANELGVAVSTVQEWITVLERSYIIMRLQPYHTNFGKRLSKSSKIYFIEPGIACFLLGLETSDQVGRDPAMGGLFENMVVVEILKQFTNHGREPKMWFFRDHVGNEIDLLIEQKGELIPVEIKSALTWHSDFAKGLGWFRKLVRNSAKGFVIYGGVDSWQGEVCDVLGFMDAAKVMRRD